MYSPEAYMFSCYNCPYMNGDQYFEQDNTEVKDIEVNEQDTKGEEDKEEDMYRVAPFYGPGPYPRPRPMPRPPYFHRPYYPRPYYPWPFYGFPFSPFFPHFPY